MKIWMMVLALGLVGSLMTSCGDQSVGRSQGEVKASKAVLNSPYLTGKTFVSADGAQKISFRPDGQATAIFYKHKLEITYSIENDEIWLNGDLFPQLNYSWYLDSSKTELICSDDRIHLKLVR